VGFSRPWYCLGPSTIGFWVCGGPTTGMFHHIMCNWAGPKGSKPVFWNPNQYHPSPLTLDRSQRYIILRDLGHALNYS
jgi:hypothetical protein